MPKSIGSNLSLIELRSNKMDKIDGVNWEALSTPCLEANQKVVSKSRSGNGITSTSPSFTFFEKNSYFVCVDAIHIIVLQWGEGHNQQIQSSVGTIQTV